MVTFTKRNQPVSKIKQPTLTAITRLAPTPSGYLHQGNAANFALNALLAGNEGHLLLRIDDLDRARFREAYLEDIFRVVDWLGIKVTEGPVDPADFHANWSQEHRLPQYQEALDHLRGHPLVFACPCSRKDMASGEHRYDCLNGNLSLDDVNVAWRINTRELDLVSIPDLVRPEPFSVDLHATMPDFVVRKKDGRPSYQPACVVDDVAFKINRVGRGQDLLPSTAAQAVLAEMMGFAPLFERINFVHHPLVVATNGEKLSKSAGNAEGPIIGTSGTPTDFFNIAHHWLNKA
jgi:glutamyl/glutaminyl-tRNA synthetase